MTDTVTVSRELLRQVLRGLRMCDQQNQVLDDTYTALRAALDAPVQEPSHDVVAGAIFDFAGFLTSHKVMIEVGSCSNASPMVERIKEWSGNRGLSLENPDVFGWQMRTAQPRKAVRLTTDEIKEAIRHLYQDATALQMSMDLSLDEFRAIEAAFIAKNGWAG